MVDFGDQRFPASVLAGKQGHHFRPVGILWQLTHPLPGQRSTNGISMWEAWTARTCANLLMRTFTWYPSNWNYFRTSFVTKR
jgi:hypothetical protein